LTDSHKLYRLVWCLNHKNCEFKNHIFVDETKVVVSDVPIYHSRLPSSIPEGVNVTDKIRKKVNIWGGISFKGPTRFPSFTTNMDRYLYAEILQDHIIPFIAKSYGNFESVFLHQDNDPKHTSGLCHNIVKDIGINYV
jgi:hypothetical protein